MVVGAACQRSALRRSRAVHRATGNQLTVAPKDRTIFHREPREPVGASALADIAAQLDEHVGVINSRRTFINHQLRAKSSCEQPQPITPLFDRLVGAREQQSRNFEPASRSLT